MENHSSGAERRKSERRDAGFTVTYNIEKPFSLGMELGIAGDVGAIMNNLSDIGMAIVTEHAIPPQTFLHIKFDLINSRLQGEDRRRRIVVIGEVVSSIPIAGGNYKLGIRFNKLSESDKIAINSFVKLNPLPGFR